MELGITWIAQHGYSAIFVLLMLGIIGLPVPDETLLLFVGYLSFTGELRLAPAWGSAFLGSACGISVSYALGRFVGGPALNKVARLAHASPEHLAKTHHFVMRWGPYALLVAYFVPGLRHLAALVVGATRLSPLRFAQFAYPGALVWSGTFIGLGYVGGEEWRQLLPLLHRGFLIGGLIVSLVCSMGILVVWRLVLTRKAASVSSMRMPEE
jgi:membrane protein DedA with SNARE-associated domain